MACGRKAGMPTPPRQHILNMTKSQHSMGDSQSHMFSHEPGRSLAFGFLSFFLGLSSEAFSPEDSMRCASASKASAIWTVADAKEGSKNDGTAAGVSRPAMTYSRKASQPTEYGGFMGRP